MSTRCAIRARGSHAALAHALLVVVAVGLPSLVRAQPPDEDGREGEPSDVIAEVRTFLEHFQVTLRANEAEAIRQLYVEDSRFSWITDGVTRYRNADEIVKALSGLAASGTVLDTTQKDVEVTELTPDLAAVALRFETNATVEGGPGFSFAGAITMLLERPAAGGWRVLHGHTSTLRESYGGGQG